MLNNRLLSLVIIIISLILVLIQYSNIRRIKQDLDFSNAHLIELKDYIHSSFEVVWKEEESEAINRSLLEAHDSVIVVYLPAGLCRSCFTSLMLSLQDNNIGGKQVKVLSESRDYEVKAVCNANDISFSVLSESIEGLDDIIVVRLYQGFYPLAMKYNLNRGPILNAFISDEYDYFQSY